MEHRIIVDPLTSFAHPSSASSKSCQSHAPALSEEPEPASYSTLRLLPPLRDNEYSLQYRHASPLRNLSVILWAGHIMRCKSHGYANEEETNGSIPGSRPRAAA
ncbi:hypothetical protein Y024_5333 [Burkholderia pseudomallei TSV44]|nr:hypothetical protein Y024_5333 [Burkholderia pseudomallei TSV44]